MSDSRPLDPKYLKGLTYRYAEAFERPASEGGRRRTGFTPRARPLAPKDVLAWGVVGPELVLVAADGQKHRLELPPAELAALCAAPEPAGASDENEDLRGEVDRLGRELRKATTALAEANRELGKLRKPERKAPAAPAPAPAPDAAPAAAPGGEG